MTAKELRKRFPWITRNEDISGADVVDQICDWYWDLVEQEKSAKKPKKSPSPDSLGGVHHE